MSQVHDMSALGQTRTLRLVRLMSALPPKADIVQHGGNVRFVPKADVGLPIRSTRRRADEWMKARPAPCFCGLNNQIEIDCAAAINAPKITSGDTSRSDVRGSRRSSYNNGAA
jgi:hypothetical protein